MIIVRAEIGDAKDILDLQKLAYQSEAQIYNDYTIPPLTQTLEEIRADFDKQVLLKALIKGKIIGSVRAFLKEGTCFIGRLIVHPDFQNRGVGAKLMNEIENCFSQAKRVELFTGHKSEKNISLYQKLGYQTFRTQTITKDLDLLFMEKFPKGDHMPTIKIMPCLDMKEGRVVKGIHFVNIKDAGDPVENAAFYEKEGADELAMLDIAATVENRKTRLEWVKNVSSVIHIPLTVGGGISTLEDIELVLKAGADNISMNSAVVRNPDLIRQASEKFGKEKVTVAIDARRNKEMPSGFELVVSGGTKPVGKDAIAWAKQCQELGAGVILPTSMDGDGTQAGYDLGFTKAISDAVDLPVVASGGAGKLEHFYEGAVQGGAQVLLAASVFHFRILSIKEVKEYLQKKGLQVKMNRVDL